MEVKNGSVLPFRRFPFTPSFLLGEAEGATGGDGLEYMPLGQRFLSFSGLTELSLRLESYVRASAHCS